MRAYFNVFLSLIIPVSALFIMLAIGYFMMEYDLSKALKLGVLSGFMIAVLFTSILAPLFILMRNAKLKSSTKNHLDQEEMFQEIDEGPLDKTFLLLMHKEMAFEVAIQAIIDQNIGEVSKESRKKTGNIIVYTPEQTIKMQISKLTKNTAELEIKAETYNESVLHIINYIKAKEHSFLQY